MQPTPVLLPEKSHGQRRLVGTDHGVTRNQIRLSEHIEHLSFFPLVGN